MGKIEGYTPGPWTIGVQEAGGPWCVGTEDYHPLAKMAAAPGEHNKANAALMAMAPTLYEENARLKSENERLLRVLTALEKAASNVNRYGASVGPQWVRLIAPLTAAKVIIKESRSAALGETE